MCEYNFYYDESEHSRKISYNTIKANNYYDNFVTVIVGWIKDDNICKRFADFEKNYEDRKNSDGEIKSTILKQKELKYGFASLNRQNVALLNDFLSIFDKDTHVYISSSSKIEYLIIQLFKDYKGNLLYNAEILTYIITKAIVLYQPSELEKSIYEEPKVFIKQLKNFLKMRIEYNEKNNPILKERENEAFKASLLVLESATDSIDISWNYNAPFDGFKKYLKEKGIINYSLIIDKEGENGENSKTLNAAIKMGLINSKEANSKDNFGIRIADFLAGIISKLMKGLRESLHYHSLDDGINKKVLSKDWFCLTEEQLELYKKLYKIICLWQPAWFKTYVSIYSDDFITFISLLNYMNGFKNVKDIEIELEKHGEYFNVMCVNRMDEFFERLKIGLPIETMDNKVKDYYLNQRGAKVFFDSNKQPILKLNKQSQTFEVLSVGINNESIALVTIMEGDKSLCFKLPNELQEWAMTVIGFANSGMNFFPCRVVFSIIDGNYYADIL